MNDIEVNPYLTWEYCTDPDIQYLNCPAPRSMRHFLPQWFRDLRGYRHELEGFAENKTVRHCLGMRGMVGLGYTIPLPETITSYDTYFSRGRLHPEMIHGTRWANKPGGPWTEPSGNVDYSDFEYMIRLLSWPWRAKMAPGWRLVVLPYLLDWPEDWNEFAGAPEPNYQSPDGYGVGSSLKWSQHLDLKYNYYNLETVMAIKRTAIVEKGTVTFCALPYFDLDLYERQTKGNTNEPTSLDPPFMGQGCPRNQIP